MVSLIPFPSPTQKLTGLITPIAILAAGQLVTGKRVALGLRRNGKDSRRLTFNVHLPGGLEFAPEIAPLALWTLEHRFNLRAKETPLMVSLGPL